MGFLPMRVQKLLQNLSDFGSILFHDPSRRPENSPAKCSAHRALLDWCLHITTSRHGTLSLTKSAKFGFWIGISLASILHISSMPQCKSFLCLQHGGGRTSSSGNCSSGSQLGCFRKSMKRLKKSARSLLDFRLRGRIWYYLKELLPLQRI